MAIHYANVLKHIGVSFKVIGRNIIKCELFEKATGIKPFKGGIEKYIAETKNVNINSKVIVAVNVEELNNVCLFLMKTGFKDILLEKPWVAKLNSIIDLVKISTNLNLNILLAYNRRFYASVIEAEKFINEDGGVSSFNFEFTEWSHVIEKLDKNEIVLNNWMVGNSTHVIDLAFFLGGFPKQLSPYFSGGIKWHPVSSIFAGAGSTESGALFSYNANWEAPGRWAVEILTKKRRIILKPLEKIQIQLLGSVAINYIDFDDSNDTNFKPGIYLQTLNFVKGDYSRFCTIKDQKNNIYNYYTKMAGYKL